MKELKFKNSVCAIIYGALFISIFLIFMCAIGFFLDYFIDKNSEHQYTELILIIFGSIIILNWVVAIFLIIFSNTIIINENEIKLFYGKKVKFEIKKNNIKEIKYYKHKWFDFLIPDSSLFLFCIISNNKTYPHCRVLLPLKTVKLIKENFDYPINIVT